VQSRGGAFDIDRSIESFSGTLARRRFTLLFYSIEAVRGRPMSEKAQEWDSGSAGVWCFMLMVFANLHDILHLAAS